MPFPVHFYNFSKRSNSTKRPAGGVSKTVYVQLKDETSILNPALTLRLQSESDFKYNYAYIPTFERYYFVNNKNFRSDNIIEVELSVDVLASFKTAIQATTAYVEFDTTANSKNVVDKRIETAQDATLQRNQADMSDVYRNTGTYVITVVSKNGCKPYRTSYNGLNYLTSQIQGKSRELFENLDETELLREGNISEYSFGNPIQCIRSCIWHPFNTPVGADTSLHLGSYDTGLNVQLMDIDPKAFYKSVVIPWQFNDWRNQSPYTQVYLNLPYVGVVNLNASELQGVNRIDVDVSVEPCTGRVAYAVSARDYQILGTYSGDASVTIPIGFNTVPPANIAAAIANRASNNLSLASNTASALFSTLINPLAGIAGAGSAIGNYMQGSFSNAASNISLLSPTPTCIGSVSGGAFRGLGAILNSISCFTLCHDTVVSPSSVSGVMGTPEYTVKSLASLSGYVKTQGAEVASEKATNTEINSINALLDGGIYIE